MWFKMATNAREFLLRQPKIHNGFATSQQDAALRAGIDDKFELEERDGDLVVHYKSPNQLCGLYRALARCIINHYGDHAAADRTATTRNAREVRLVILLILWGMIQTPENVPLVM